MQPAGRVIADIVGRDEVLSDLAALLARDRFLPSQFVNLGDRLAYSNGIIVLAGLATLLLVAFRANVNSLIHLYVIGVFTAFRKRRLNLSPHHPASSIGAGIGISPEACMVDSEMLLLPSSSTLPLSR